VALTPEGSPDLPMFLNNLANGLSDRYGRTGKLADLEEAIRYYEQGVRIAGEIGDQRIQGVILSHLGDAYYKLSDIRLGR